MNSTFLFTVFFIWFVGFIKATLYMKKLNKTMYKDDCSTPRKDTVICVFWFISFPLFWLVLLIQTLDKEK